MFQALRAVEVALALAEVLEVALVVQAAAAVVQDKQEQQALEQQAVVVVEVTSLLTQVMA
jgi:hypothetical protein